MPHVDDFYPDGMIHGAVVTAASPGRVSGLSIPLLPTGYGVITASDIPGSNKLEVGGVEIPLLASGHVAYTGQPVALLYGPDPDELVTLSRGCSVRYSNKQSGVRSNTSAPVIDRKIGNPDKAFSEAFQVIESRYSVGPDSVPSHQHRGGIASAFVYSEGSELVVAAPTVWPFHVRDTVAAAIGTPPKTVRVMATDSSAPNHVRLWMPSIAAAYAAIIAELTAAPVKLIGENIIPQHHRDASFAEVVYRTALKPDGDLLAVDIIVQIDVGAYPILAKESLERFCLGLRGAYRCKHVRISGGTSLTDNLPGRFSAISSLGKGFSVAEVNATRVVEVSQRGVLEWRSANCMKSLPFSSKEKHDVSAVLATLFGKVGKMSDFSRKHASYEMQKKRRNPDSDTIGDSPAEGPETNEQSDPASQDETRTETPRPLAIIFAPTDLLRRGIGFASSMNISGFLHPVSQDPGSLVVKLDTDGDIDIRSTATLSQNSRAAWRKVASELVGVESEAVHFAENDTGVSGDNGPGVFSRNITVNHRLIEQCCRSIQKKRFRSPLPLEVKRGTRGAQQSYPEVIHPVAYGAAAVEVSIDPVTFAPIVKGVWIAIDAGNIVNEAGATSCVESEIYQLMRQIGSPSTGEEISIKCRFCGDRRRSPAGIEGLASSLIPAALSCAVSQAFGYYFDEIPLTINSVFTTAEGA